MSHFFSQNLIMRGESWEAQTWVPELSDKRRMKCQTLAKKTNMYQTLRMLRKRQWDRLKTAKRKKSFFKKKKKKRGIWAGRILKKEQRDWKDGIPEAWQTQPLQASASGREAEAFPLTPYLPILCHPPDTECMAVSSSIRSQLDVEEEPGTPQPHARVLPGRTLQQSLTCMLSYNWR